MNQRQKQDTIEIGDIIIFSDNKERRVIDKNILYFTLSNNLKYYINDLYLALDTKEIKLIKKES